MTFFRPHKHGARRGIASVLAMLYLMLFTVLGIGFYAASSMAVQIARDDRAAADAQTAAESGMEFMRYQLGDLEIATQTPDATLLNVVAQSLAKTLDGSANMRGHRVDTTGDVLQLPSSDSFITLDAVNGTQFQAHLAVSGGAVWVKVIGRGRDSTISRAIQLRFDKTSHRDMSRLVPVSSTYQEVLP